MNTKQPRDMFGFDDEQPLDSTAIPDDMLAADDRTLRLAAPDISPEKVDAFLRYQRALRERLTASPLHAHRDDHLATAHREALEVSGLDAKAHAQVSSVASQFATRRTTVRTLQQKQAELRRRMAETEAAGEDPTDEQKDLDQKITTELARLEPLQTMERRYGAEAIRALQAREPELLDLHAEVRRLVSK